MTRTELTISLKNSFEKAINKMDDEQIDILFGDKPTDLKRVGLQMISMSLILAWLMDEEGMEGAMDIWRNVSYLEDPEGFMEKREEWLKEHDEK